MGCDVDVVAPLGVVACTWYGAEEMAPVEMAEDVLSMSTGSPKAMLWKTLVLWKTVVVLLYRVGDVIVGVVG